MVWRRPCATVWQAEAWPTIGPTREARSRTTSEGAARAELIGTAMQVPRRSTHQRTVIRIIRFLLIGWLYSVLHLNTFVLKTCFANSETNHYPRICWSELSNDDASITP